MPERVIPRMTDTVIEPALQELQKNMTGQNRIADKTEMAVIAHPSGATSSHIALRYDLISRNGLRLLAETYTRGVPKHGERNWIKGLGDKQFILDRLNHMFEHAIKLVHPQKTDDEYSNTHRGNIEENLGAIMWVCCFLADVLEHEDGSRILINEIVSWSK